MSYFLADTTGYLDDFASIGGLRDFFDWAQTQDGPMSELAKKGFTEDLDALVLLLKKVQVPSKIQPQVAVLKKCAPVARELLIISDSIDDEMRHAGFDPNQPRDEQGQWTDGGGGSARRFEGNAGYDWHEQGPVVDWAVKLPYDDVQAISGYAGFGYGDINRQLRGQFEPRIIDEYVRPATPAEIAAHKNTLFKSDPHEYAPDDPTNKVAGVEGGRTVHNVFTRDPVTNETVEYSVQRAVPDLKYVEELKAKATQINGAIRQRGYVLPEAISVNRAAYLPGMSYEDLKAKEGEVIEEKGFTSTMLGNPSGRLDGYVVLAKTESIYKRYEGQKISAHQDEIGAAMRVEIVLPKGTKVAPVEALRRIEHEFPRKVVPVPESLKDNEWFKEHPETYTERDYTAKPTVKTDMLKDKGSRTEAEILLGSDAQFRVESVRRGDKRIVSSDPSLKPVDVIDVKLTYVGGGSSAR